MTEQALPAKEAARSRITELTHVIVQAANDRAEAALEVGQAKVYEGATQVRDLDREALVISSVIEMNEGPLSNAAVARIVQTIMNEASNLQAETFGLPLGVPLQEGPGFSALPENIS